MCCFFWENNEHWSKQNSCFNISHICMVREHNVRYKFDIRVHEKIFKACGVLYVQKCDIRRHWFINSQLFVVFIYDSQLPKRGLFLMFDFMLKTKFIKVSLSKEFQFCFSFKLNSNKFMSKWRSQRIG